ncbi:MAG: cysteine peptidase family C39 domain-containing protein, partial [Candidatus Omnitrophota bacterium]
MQEKKEQKPREASKEVKPEFKSSFKAWIRIVAFIVVAIFLPEQVAQAVEYDWRILWQQPTSSPAFNPPYLKDIANIDVPLAVRSILLDISGKPINEIKISPTQTITLEKPLNLSKRRIEELFNWLKGKPCGAKALYDYLRFQGIEAQEQDIAVMALTVDILNEVVKPQGNPKVIKNSLYALSEAAKFFGNELSPVKFEVTNQRDSKLTKFTPFIAHLKGDHYVLVTRIDDEKVYYSDEHKEEFLPREKFFQRFSGYALIIGLQGETLDFKLVPDKEAKTVMGAEDSIYSSTWDDGSGGYYGSSSFYIPAGYSIPSMPSFSTNSITPNYYFAQPMYVNDKGFSTEGTKFINPAGMAYTSIPDYQQTHGTPVWFHNGLDAVAFHPQGPFVKYIDPSFMKGLGLDKIRVVDAPMSVTKLDRDGKAFQSQRPVYTTSTGLKFTLSAVQKQSFINENFKNTLDKDSKIPSAQDQWKDKDNRISNMPAHAGLSRAPNGYVIFEINSPTDFFHWNYGAGPYVQPGDVFYGKDKDSIGGLGSTPEFQKRIISSDPVTKAYQVQASPIGDFILNQGRLTGLTRAEPAGNNYGGIAKAWGEGFETHGTTQLYSIGDTNVAISVEGVNAKGILGNTNWELKNVSGSARFKGQDGELFKLISTSGSGNYSVNFDLKNRVVDQSEIGPFTVANGKLQGEGKITGIGAGELTTRTISGQQVDFIAKGLTIIPASNPYLKGSDQEENKLSALNNPTELDEIRGLVFRGSDQKPQEGITLANGVFPMIVF